MKILMLRVLNILTGLLQLFSSSFEPERRSLCEKHLKFHEDLIRDEKKKTWQVKGKIIAFVNGTRRILRYITGNVIVFHLDSRKELLSFGELPKIAYLFLPKTTRVSSSREEYNH